MGGTVVLTALIEKSDKAILPICLLQIFPYLQSTLNSLFSIKG